MISDILEKKILAVVGRLARYGRSSAYIKVENDIVDLLKSRAQYDDGEYHSDMLRILQFAKDAAMMPSKIGALNAIRAELKELLDLYTPIV